MKLNSILPMGCLPSRSTTVAPADKQSNGTANGQKRSSSERRATTTTKSKYPNIDGQRGQADSNGGLASNGRMKDRGKGRENMTVNRRNSMGNNGGDVEEGEEDDIMSIILNNDGTKSPEVGNDAAHPNNRSRSLRSRRRAHNGDTRDDELRIGNNEADDSSSSANRSLEQEGGDQSEGSVAGVEDRGGSDQNNNNNNNNNKGTNENSFDDDLDMDLLRQYVTVDFEIQQLEDKDALRVYHEKIDQLEQLERELDMISAEAEEMAVRSESTKTQHSAHQNGDSGQSGDTGVKDTTENNSLLSGGTGSLSPKSSMFAPQRQVNQNNNIADGKSPGARASGTPKKQPAAGNQSAATTTRRFKNFSYTTVEDVFNRKILLEKERDKLKKEVELVIIECDRLQQRYRKRDEILDKLFDGRTGNGLENHLEQQLNWLLEQKHYVDQVFYAWKRAETLTSQTCEQFASALELIKRLPKVQEEGERAELAKSITNLLVKSRKDMEQAQKYNPNVDAPFFTENETERFDKIIETISSQSISSSDYSQTLTVIQFAYKRAVSIRLWLEQILQITIARDSFELAEEYKWIAIQLRKERINLIKAKLQDSEYQPMVQEVHEQLARQQSINEKQQQRAQQLRHQQQQQHQQQTSNHLNKREADQRNDVNRDSGVESVDIDIEEEIYRLLESNRAILEQSGGASGSAGPINGRATPQFDQQLKISSATNNNNAERDQMMRDRINRRVQGNHQPLASLNRVPSPLTGGAELSDALDGSHSATSTATATSVSKLRIELDEEARQSLLKQVDQIHTIHRDRLERIRGNSKARAANSMINRMQQANGKPPS